MPRIKVRHYCVKGRRAYWQPTRQMRQHGFSSVRLGNDGPAAWAKAEEWNLRWDDFRNGVAPTFANASADNLSPHQLEEKTIYPTKSIGEGFKRYRRTDEWSRKAPATRDDWWRGWKRIRFIFGDCDPRTVTLRDLSAWRAAIEETVSLREAHRALKIWRALWKVCASLGYCQRDADPSLSVRNRAAPGRSATWSEGEAARLFKQAWRDENYGLATIVAVAWSSQLSPGDVRALRASQLVKDGAGVVFFTQRAKTAVPVGGALSSRALAALMAYLKVSNLELHSEAFIFRSRTGAPYSKDLLSKDFRAAREAVFGPGESRTLADFRRSGAVEAIAGDATPAQLAHAMGSTLGSSNQLFATYVPVNLSSVRAIQEARRRGRSKL
jgi:hypothetical protein